MKVSLESVSDTEKRLEISIPAEDVRAKFDEVIEGYKRSASVKGFRKGKVPRGVVESAYKDNIRADVAQDLVSATLTEALEEVSLNPVTRPNITPGELTPGEGFGYSVEFEIVPEFELGEYIGIELEREETSVTDEDIDHVLKHLRERYAEAKPLKSRKTVRNGDIVTVDYTAAIDGKPVDELRGEDSQLVVGEGRLVPEFDENLPGMKVGEEKGFEVTYDESSNVPGVAGKTAVFTVTLKDIRTKVLPKLGDAFAKDVGADDMEALRARIAEEETQRAENTAKAGLKEGVAEHLMSVHGFDVPPSLVAGEKANLARGVESRMRGMGLNPPPEIDAETDEHLQQSAERNVKVSVILGHIARKEGLEVGEEEIDEHFAEMAKSLQLPPAKLREYYESNNMLESLMGRLLEEKTLEFLLDKAQITTLPPSQKQIDIKTE